MVKAKAIILNSSFAGEEIDVKVQSGFCKVDIDKEEKHEFFLDKSAPIKVGFQKNPLKTGSYDFYILSWKSLIPLEFETVENEIESKDLETEMKKEGMSEKEIEKAKKNIEKEEKKEGKKIKKFIFRKIEPITITKEHWSKTELPAVVRETGEMRFLKALKSYTEGGGGGVGIGGRGLIIGFAVVFMGLMILYSMFVAGVFG